MRVEMIGDPLFALLLALVLVVEDIIVAIVRASRYLRIQHVAKQR